MAREPLSVVIITYNNGGTLDACLRGVTWADEIVVLDSGSTDDTVAIAQRYGARVSVHPFDEFGPQKQRAYDLASNDWILNLDADETLSAGTREVIEHALVAPRYAGYRLPRRELLFWKVQHRWGRRNGLLRLFDRRHGRMNHVEVHSAVELDGPVKTLRRADFVNHGDVDISTRMNKINGYTTRMVAHKLRKKQRFTGLRRVFYPPWFFVRQYIGKRYFLDGWAGFIASMTGAFYVFLKYAKLHEARQVAALRKRAGDR
ncbi:glycosyltransferase family 2 protein [Dyella silvatica]|uniref:glycosyltransferase family 2 protein n=1 Tax=Dyella silvatica TaxID=2992128 RepID=UPI00225ACDA6|nr:glycosyltransferase family 2 protein [Dyella silvatica]